MSSPSPTSGSGKERDLSAGFPPTLTHCNTTSLGKQLQHAHPGAKAVKALNTMSCAVMVDPARVPGEHHAFVCGDDARGGSSAVAMSCRGDAPGGAVGPSRRPVTRDFEDVVAWVA